MRVLIVDPHPVTRDGLRAALSRAGDFEVAGEASTGEEALEVAAGCSPDIVVMAVGLPGMDGIEATRVMHEVCPDAKVVLFTTDESRETVSGAIQAGVSGYLLKDSTAVEIVAAARLAVQGGAVIHPKITQALIEEARASGGEGRKPLLSPRETQILQAIAHGATTKRAAQELGISPHTVKTHLERIFEKLGAHDRAQAVATGIREGLIA